MVRKSFGNHTLHFLPEVNLDVSSWQTSAREEAVGPQEAGAAVPAREQVTRQATEHFNSILEFMIRKVPEQYFWLHNRWK